LLASARALDKAGALDKAAIDFIKCRLCII
jgi:hypothetical protein